MAQLNALEAHQHKTDHALFLLRDALKARAALIEKIGEARKALPMGSGADDELKEALDDLAGIDLAWPMERLRRERDNP